MYHVDKECCKVGLYLKQRFGEKFGVSNFVKHVFIVLIFFWQN